jgi:hypothetical protein
MKSAKTVKSRMRHSAYLRSEVLALSCTFEFLPKACFDRILNGRYMSRHGHREIV